ncbi:BrnA antitoxin family protein [Neorhizobium sp. T25_13]|uniref:BrnA antitoxin family protein n=1 Tax=Neorhizobium sp. T25_13 TaxID=2093830 RepID=UPI000CF92E48|nr:BrnA antitoxin family protein [Neorhizobium sp. T25_13]
MTESKKPMVRDSLAIEDDAPDLTESPWAEKLTAAPVIRGRPKSEQTKVSTTIRLDADVLEGFRAAGPGWQSRINDVLREWLARR